MKNSVSDNEGQPVIEVRSSWDESSHTLYLGFDNSPGGIKVNIEW